jgi:hypothetical protein
MKLKITVELFPERFSIINEGVLFGRNTTKRENWKLNDKKWLSPEFPLFVKHAYLV